MLWRHHLKHNPKNRRADRDRFVLSNGHGSMLLYSLLHLSGYDPADGGNQEFPPIAFEDRRHPITPVKPPLASTWPAWGMRIADRTACAFNLMATDIVDHHTWVFLAMAA